MNLLFLLALMIGDGQPDYRLSMFSYAEHSIFCFSSDKEVVTLSWYPRGKLRWTGSQPGMNLDYDNSVKRAESMGYRVRHDGTYRIDKAIFEAAKRQRDRLDSGQIAYRKSDLFTRSNAVNCRGAILAIVKPRPLALPYSGSAANRCMAEWWGLELVK